VQSFTASMSFLAATSTFRLGRRCWSSRQCYLHCLHTSYQSSKGNTVPTTPSWFHPFFMHHWTRNGSSFAFFLPALSREIFTGDFLVITCVRSCINLHYCVLVGLSNAVQLQSIYSANRKLLVIRKPAVKITTDFMIKFK